MESNEAKSRVMFCDSSVICGGCKECYPLEDICIITVCRRSGARQREERLMGKDCCCWIHLSETVLFTNSFQRIFYINDSKIILRHDALESSRGS